MKKILFLFAAFASSLGAFADSGAKITVNGLAKNGYASLYIRADQMTRIGQAPALNGLAKVESNVEKPGFFVFDSSVLKNLDMFLAPGDDISISVENNLVKMSGKGGKINQFLFDISQKFNYKTGSAKEVYRNRVNAINACKHEEVVRNKAALLGYAQGEYLDKVFGPYMESKAFGESDKIMQVDLPDLDMKLLPEIVNYYNWSRTVTEIMYAKMQAGKLKVRSINTWVADFSKAIENQELREQFIVQQLDLAIICGDLVGIKETISEALPLVKDPKNIATIKGFDKRIAAKATRYDNALPGTDLSSYTFLRPDGTTAAIGDYKGKYIFIDIWATFCHPCVAEIPFLKKLEHEMEGKDIVFVSISADYKADTWKAFLKKRNLTGEQLLMKEANKDPFFMKIGKTGIPRFVILDKEGKMVDYNTYKRPSNPLLKQYLNELLSKK